MKPAIAYYRVSTGKQERSGLGIEAQIFSILNFAQHSGFTIIDSFTETVSGRSKKRPILSTALALCKKQKATLIIAKLDRMSRRVAFVANLMESRVDFVVVSTPTASPFEHHINASFAEKESVEISKRTKDALAAAKNRGTVLGTYGRDVLSKQNASAADQFAQAMRPTIEAIQGQGVTTIRGIRDELNRQEVPTYRNNGQSWHFAGVYALLKRIEQISATTLDKYAPGKTSSTSTAQITPQIGTRFRK